MSNSLILLLHAHLPFVKHPEYMYSLEENWLFEAIRETYVPLLYSLENLVNDGISPGLTLTVSPPLTEMLNDRTLRKRFIRYMDNLIGLSESELARTRETAFGPAAALYHSRFKQVKQLYLKRYKQDLVGVFRKLQDDGHIEIVATCATHAFLPAFENCPDIVERQIAIGVESYTRCFGRRPSGFWLPECGYFRGLDKFLKRAGIKYFFLESHGLLNGDPAPRFGVYEPVRLSSGLKAFGRDSRSSSQVWCATRGYPGDPFYRDFYRDIGFDLPREYIAGHTRMESIRTFTGIKYHRITGKDCDKLPYERQQAMGKVLEHARHFTDSRNKDFSGLSRHDLRPVIFSAFDAELFGHWWFEGIEWLETVFRNAEDNRQTFRILTPGLYLKTNAHRKIETVEPSPSSWGEGGYNALWISKRNHHLYRHLHKMSDMMKAMKKKRHKIAPRILAQAMREMLLAQSSDWPFAIQKETASEYAESRVKTHIGRFSLLFSMLMDNKVDIELLREIEKRDSIFPWLARQAAGY